MRKPTLSRRLLFGIFTVSGFSGLIYESIWSHYLKLFLGHAAYAQTLVLAIFMGGMALGAWLVARNTARIRNLLVAYAAVELVTGIIALLFHRIYEGSLGFAFDTAIPALGSGGTIAAFKWTLASLLILPQSIMLGTTFPLISAGVIRRFPERSGETLAMLYFTNSLGAALGVLASGFWLIGAVGLPGTVMTAGLLNVLLALFVWVLARDQNAGGIAADPPLPKTAPAAVHPLARWIFVAAFFAGLAAFLYEIAWIRMLSMVLGSSTHAFELMLSAFILGLALGGYWVRRRIDGYASPLRALAIMFALMAILGALTLPMYGYAFDVMSATLRTFSATETGYAGFNVISQAIAAAMMIPTTVVAGMTLPLMTHYLLRTDAGEAAIGRVYAANTVGAIAGVLLAIHALLPHVGTKGAIVAAALVQVAIALMLLLREQPAWRTRFSLAATVSAGALVMIIAVSVQLDPMKMAAGVYRFGSVRLPPGAEVIFLRDGKTATITLAKLGDEIVIATNGKPDAGLNMGPGGTQPDEITMALAGAVPMVVHPNPRHVANIGLGCGLTSQVALASPTLEVLDSVEIEPVVAEAGRLGFHARVSRLYDDPRSRIHFEDAKTFFASTRQRYDVIISEPSNPWVSGVATLFSTEFYAQIKRYLAPEGLFVQWVQTYETDMTVIASIAKAISAQFADYEIYNTDDSNVLILATRTGSVPDINAAALRGALAAELDRVGIESAADIRLRRIGGKRLLDPLFASYPVPTNSDYFPFVDLTSPRMRYLRRTGLALNELNRLPVPVMELLGEPGPAAGARSSQREHHSRRQRMVQQALDIREGMQRGTTDRIPSAVGPILMTIGTQESRCKLPGITQTWTQAVRSLADLTTPALAADDLRPMWQSIRGSDCFAHLDEQQRNALAYLEAVAMRDRDGIVRFGGALLSQSPELPADFREQIVLAVSASLLAAGNTRSAAELLQAYAPMVVSLRDGNLGFRLVESIAVAGLSTKILGNE